MLTKQRLLSESYRVIDNLNPPTFFDRDSQGFFSHQIGSILVREKRLVVYHRLEINPSTSRLTGEGPVTIRCHDHLS